MAMTRCTPGSNSDAGRRRGRAAGLPLEEQGSVSGKELGHAWTAGENRVSTHRRGR